jgi:hypothetical protein
MRDKRDVIAQYSDKRQTEWVSIPERSVENSSSSSVEKR